MKKRIVTLLLAAALVTQLASPCWASDGGAAQNDDILGRISICSSARPYQTEWDAVLHEEELILMTPEDIAAVAGANSVSYNSRTNCYTFRRGAYRVVADVEHLLARIYIDVTSTDAVEPYSEAFRLEYATQMEVDGENRDFLPLEQMLYLLNVQWTCSAMTVYAFAPKETLWNLVGDYRSMVSGLPNKAEVLGDSLLRYYGNAAKYAMLSLADEIDLTLFVPVFDNFSYSREKNALLRLAGPFENVQDDLADAAASSLSKSLTDLGSLAQNFADFAGGADAAQEILQRFSKWLEAEPPSGLPYLSAGSTALSGVTGLFNATLTAARYQAWTAGFVEDMEYLSTVEDKRYGLYTAELNFAAGSLSSEYGNLTGNLAWEYAWSLAGTVVDTLVGKTLGGKILGAYKGAIAMADQLSPAFAGALDRADTAADSLYLCNLTAFMLSQYQTALNDFQGKPITQESLDSIRRTGALLMSAAGHSRDALYSVRKAEGADVTELGKQLVSDFTDYTRFVESAQYDPSLLLYADYHNLYSSVAGASREEIPPEYVRYGKPAVFSSCIAEWNGTVYEVGVRTGSHTPEEMGLTPLNIQPAAYDYIAAFTIYKGMVYYACKESGTSDYHSAIYRCNLDGSEQTQLVGPDENSVCDFYILNDRLYYNWYYPEYLDLETGELCPDDNYVSPGMSSEQYSAAFHYVAFEDGIYCQEFDVSDGGSIDYGPLELLIPLESGYHATIHAATDDALYYTYWSGNLGYLYRYDLETGAVTELDSHIIAGGGSDGYFSW